jgi:hypothetical protein
MSEASSQFGPSKELPNNEMQTQVEVMQRIQARGAKISEII